MEMNIFIEEDQRILIVKRAIKNRLATMAEEGLEWVLISGQMGVELWAADVVLSLKEVYPLHLAVIPPFEQHAKRWPEQWRHKYETLISLADFYQPLYRGGYKGPFQYQKRDRFFVKKSDGCLLLIDDEHPGSVQYYKKIALSAKDYPIYQITPFDLNEVAEEMQREGLLIQDHKDY